MSDNSRKDTNIMGPSYFTKRLFSTYIPLLGFLLLTSIIFSQPANNNTKAVGRVTVEDFGKAGAGPFNPAASRGVFIGINEFTSTFGNKPGDLKSCVNDAVDLAAAFCNLGLIEPKGVTLILSGEPGKAKTREHLQFLTSHGATILRDSSRHNIDRQITKNTMEVTDKGIFFLTCSSHGFESGNVQYLAPSDMYFTRENPSTSELQYRALSESIINETINNQKVKRAIVIFDACRESKQMAPGMPELISAAKGMVTLYAVTSGKLAIDGNKNGQFTEKVLGALTAEAPPENLKGSTQGYVTVRTLMDYLGTAGRYEDAEILNMPLCRHPGLYLHAERSREVIEYYKQAKVVDMNASRNRRYFTHIGVLDVELALESPAGPELADEIEYYLDTPEKQKNYRNRKSFADAYHDLTSAPLPPTPTPRPTTSTHSSTSSTGSTNPTSSDPFRAKHDAAYNEAKTADESSYTTIQQKIDAWEKFLSDWPVSPQKNKVNGRIRELKMESAYEQAVASESVSEMQAFINQYPDFPRIFEAQGKLQEFKSRGPSHGDIKTIDLGDGVTMDLVYIKPGTFKMGSEDGDSNEKPITTVTLTKGFWMGKTEVTVEQFRHFVSDTSYRTEAETGDGAYGWTGSAWKKDKKYNWKNPGFSQSDQCPVTCVSWNDSIKFCQWLEDKSGLEITLPTEAQWEYACRAGTTTRFSFGDSDSQLGDYAWYSANSGSKTHPVGTKKPNGFGLYDMHGNVWEWCLDWYDDYPGGSVSDYKGASSGSVRVFRGGDWSDSAGLCRSAFRSRSPPGARGGSLGVRVCLAVPVR